MWSAVYFPHKTWTFEVIIKLPYYLSVFAWRPFAFFPTTFFEIVVDGGHKRVWTDTCLHLSVSGHVTSKILETFSIRFFIENCQPLIWQCHVTPVLRCLVLRPHYSEWPKLFGSRGPSENVRLGYVTEINWPRETGKTPYMDQARTAVEFAVCSSRLNGRKGIQR